MRPWRLACVMVSIGLAGCALNHGGEAIPTADSAPRMERLGPFLPPFLDVARVATPDGCHLVYVTSKGDKRVLVIDGQSGPEFDTVGGLVFSSDGKHVAYAAQKGDKWVVVVDGEAGPEFDGIGQPGCTFSPDGNRVAYSAGKGNKMFVVLDGQPGPEFDGLTAGPVFRRDGNLECLVVKENFLYRVTVPCR